MHLLVSPVALDDVHDEHAQVFEINGAEWPDGGGAGRGRAGGAGGRGSREGGGSFFFSFSVCLFFLWLGASEFGSNVKNLKLPALCIRLLERELFKTKQVGVSGEGSGLGVWGWVWGLGYLVGFGVGFAWVRVNDHN